MTVFDMRIEWTRTSDTDTVIPITDCISATINKSTEVKNNICQLNLKNSPSVVADDGSTVIGEYVETGTQEIKFAEEDQFQVWTAFLSDASEVGTSWYNDARRLGTFSLEEFQLSTSANESRVTLKAVDTAYLLFNSIYTFSYGVTNKFTAPGIIRHCARKFGESTPNTVTSTAGTHNDTGTQYAIDAQFTSEGGKITDTRSTPTNQLDGAINDSVTTLTVDSTTGFESAGTVVVDSEHISYTGTTATTFTGCTRGIDDTAAASHLDNATVTQGFPLILMSKIWKPLFEWIGEASQNENTNYTSETQEGGTLFFNRAFLFWIDKDNKANWVYPDDSVDLTVTLAEEGRRAFKLEKAVFDSVNFVVFNCGEDMYGNGIIHYFFDESSGVAALKMRYQPMSKIVHTLMQEDLIENSTRETTPTDIFKQFVTDGSYNITPSFLDDANLFRASNGDAARVNVTNDTEYNDALREACKWRGIQEARKITTKRSGLRYRGRIAIKGAHVDPGDLITVTNGFVGLNAQNVRVLGVTHQINSTRWETILDVEEDETTV